MNYNLTAAKIRAAKFNKRAGVLSLSAALALGVLLAGVTAGCGGGGSSSSGPSAPGLPVTPTSGDFNDLVVRLDIVGGSYTVTKLASYSNGAPYTTFGTYVPNNNGAKTPIWTDDVANGTQVTVTSPVGFYIDDTSDPTVFKERLPQHLVHPNPVQRRRLPARAGTQTGQEHLLSGLRRSFPAP